MAVLPQMTLPQLRTEVRRRANMEHSDFVTEDELNSYINGSLFALYDLLVTSYGADYYVKDVELSTGGNDRVPLPEDFYKLIGVDAKLGGGQWITLKQFNFAERNRYSNPLRVVPYYTNMTYAIMGNELRFRPSPQGPVDLRLWYVPRMRPLVDPLTITFQSTQPGDVWVWESFMGVTFTDSPTPTASEVQVGDSDERTAQNFVNYMEQGGMLPNDAIFVRHGNSVEMRLQWSVLPTTVFNEVYSSNPLRIKIEGGLPPTGDSYTGRDPPLYSDTFSDGISGWLDYVVIDAAIKCLEKEESDTRVLYSQKKEIEKRIVDTAPTRDVGSPPTVVDSNATGSWYNLSSDYDWPY